MEYVPSLVFAPMMFSLEQPRQWVLTSRITKKGLRFPHDGEMN